MQLTIIGAGAIGGTIGAHLIRDGHDILLCDADPAHVAAINERGLEICGPVENFTVQALEPLEIGVRSIYRDTLASIHDGVPLSDALWRNLVPAELEPYPDVVTAFLLMREGAIKRLYSQLTGYWKPDREGMEVFSAKDQAAVLDLVTEGDPGRLARAGASLNERGDFAAALRIAELGLRAHPSTASLAAVRTRALEGLRTKYQLSPFKFIVYSEAAAAELASPPGGEPVTAAEPHQVNGRR